MKKLIENLFITLALFAGIHPATAQISFVLSPNYPVGAGPNSLCAADVNGDGKPDLISANLTDNSITVLTNNGGGGFSFNANYAAGDHPQTLTAADVNGDGKMDLIVADNGRYDLGYSDRLTVLTNNGSGGFAFSSSPVVGLFPNKVIAADVNGDGKMDLISANYLAFTVSVLTNDGSGGFVASGTYPMPTGAFSVAAADVNGDGKVDLICANTGSSGYGRSLTVLTNDGSGGFGFNETYLVGRPSSYSAPNGSYPASVVAFTNVVNGKVDLACANAWDDTVSLLTNNSSGGLVLVTNYPVGHVPITLVAADVNGDGKVDLVCDNSYDNTLSVLTNDGVGGFVLATNFSSGNSGPAGVNVLVTADVNGDGRPDLIVSDWYANALRALINTSLTPAPPLGITTVSSLPVVVWSASATNFVLQMTTNLASGNWVTVTNGIPFIGVQITNAPASAFFRLH